MATQCAPVMALHSGGEQLLRIANCQVHEVRQSVFKEQSYYGSAGVQRHPATQVAGQHQVCLAQDAELSVVAADNTVHLQVGLYGCLLGQRPAPVYQLPRH